MSTPILVVHYREVFHTHQSAYPVFSHFEVECIYSDDNESENFRCDTFDAMAEKIGAKMFYAQHYGFTISVVQDDPVIA